LTAEARHSLRQPHGGAHLREERRSSTRQTSERGRSGAVGDGEFARGVPPQGVQLPSGKDCVTQFQCIATQSRGRKSEPVHLRVTNSAEVIREEVTPTSRHPRWAVR